MKSTNGKNTLHILIIDDSRDDTNLILYELGKYYKLVWQRVETEANLIIALDTEWDVILCDYKLPQFSMEKALEIVQRYSAEIPFITVSGYVTEKDLIGFRKKGVYDFINKDNLEILPDIVEREVRRWRERKDERLRNEIVVKEAYERTIEAWGKAMELRDKYTQGHTTRVTDLSLRLAVQMSISHADFVDLNRGALLHDIGKMGIPDAVLFKQDALDDEEWRIMRKHPELARDMLVGIPFLERAIDIPYCHHERWNGRGYPRGLKGEEIPFLARLFAVVDVYDALTTDRPYRPSWEKSKVIAYLLDEKGIAFDPEVVDAFVDMIGRG